MIWGRRTAGAIIAAAVFLGWYGELAAQTALEDSVALRPRPDLDPIGIPLGPEGGFLVFPRLEIAGEYTDNLFKTDTGETSDEIGLFTPSVKIQSDWDQHAVLLSGTTTYAKHVDNSTEDWWDYTGRAHGRLDVTETSQVLSTLTFSRKHEDRRSPDDPARGKPTRYLVGTANVRGVYNPDVFLIDIDLRADRIDFRDNGATNNDDRDRDQYSARGRVGYEWVPGSTAFVEGAYEMREFDDSVDDAGLKRSSDGYEVLAGNTLDLSGVAFLELAAGYRVQKFDDPTLSDVQGFSFSGELTWNPTDLLTITGRARRSVRETTIAGASGIFTSAFNLDADYELLDNLILDLRSGFELQEFKGVSRDDKLFDVAIGGRYMIGPNFFAGARYGFEQRNSDITVNEFTVNTIRVYIGAQI